MRKWGWIGLLCVLLLAGAASDHWGNRAALIGQQNSIQVTAPFSPQYTANEEPQSSVALVSSLCGIDRFASAYHTSGAGQKVALIDSGIDLSHVAFQKNRDRSNKVIQFRDYTQEGVLYPQEVDSQGDKVAVGGAIYYTGQQAGSRYRMAFLQLSQLQPQMFSEQDRQLAVLVVASGDVYDTVYVDTNQNWDFSDETALRCYGESTDYVTLYNAGCRLALALTNIEPDGSQIQLSTDTLGHGTFLAGLMAANGTEYQGLTPQAQLCVYKIFDRAGQSSQLLLAQAIRQAILDDVQCINLSLSIPQSEPVCDELAEVLNQARAANISIVAAAGNYGPGKNTTAYPARNQTVIGVGSYVAPEMYALDRALMLEEPFIADYSGRGQLNGESSPLLVAPAGLVSTVPGWYAQDYLYDCGTSISAAVTTAALVHVLEAADKQGLLLSVEQLKNLLARWAQDQGFSATEQGYGSLRLGTLPVQASAITQREGLREETVIYSGMISSWKFSIPQGQSRSWYVQVDKGTKELTAVMQLDGQSPQNEMEHLVALGRCRLSLYDPAGKLVDQTLYLGASYGQEIVTSGAVEAKNPKAGVWELVITSADDLSQYNHFTSDGTLQLTQR